MPNKVHEVIDLVSRGGIRVRLPVGGPPQARTPTAEKGLSTAASGQSHRQNGMTTISDPAMIPPVTTYAQKVISSPCRLIRT